MMLDQDSCDTQKGFSLPKTFWFVFHYTNRCNHQAGRKTPRSIPQTNCGCRTSRSWAGQRNPRMPNCLASSLSSTLTEPTRHYPSSLSSQANGNGFRDRYAPMGTPQPSVFLQPHPALSLPFRHWGSDHGSKRWCSHQNSQQSAKDILSRRECWTRWCRSAISHWDSLHGNHAWWYSQPPGWALPCMNCISFSSRKGRQDAPHAWGEAPPSLRWDDLWKPGLNATGDSHNTVGFQWMPLSDLDEQAHTYPSSWHDIDRNNCFSPYAGKAAVALWCTCM